jgi:hypothetical protein
MSYQEVHEQLHRLVVLNTQFDAHLRSAEQNWDEILLKHLLLCQVEAYLQIKENQ